MELPHTTPAESLPAWLYTDPAFFALEARMFRRTWQIVCHLSDLPQPGDYQALDLLAEQVVAVRGEDGEVRSFHNVCRHRASRLLDGAQERVQAGMASSSYTTGPLSPDEVCLAAFAERLRAAIPEAAMAEAPDRTP